MTTRQSDWVQLGLRYGLGGALALFLTYQMAVAQASDLKQLLADHQDMKVFMQELRFYMRGTCLNTADTEAERLNCFPDSK